MRTIVVLTTLAVLIAGCTGASGGSAPDFSVRDTEGKTISLEELEGQAVVIMFGAAIGCESCKIYSKNVLRPLAQETNGSVQILMLSIVSSETDQDLRDLKREVNATWPLARDTDRVAQRDSVYSLTTIAVIDADHDLVLKKVEPSLAEVKEKLGL